LRTEITVVPWSGIGAAGDTGGEEVGDMFPPDKGA